MKKSENNHEFEILLRRGVKITSLNVLRLLDDAQHPHVSPPTISALTELAFEEASKASQLIAFLIFVVTYPHATGKNDGIQSEEYDEEVIDPIVDFEDYFNRHLRNHHFKLQEMLKRLEDILETLKNWFATSGYVGNLRSLDGVRRVLTHPKLTELKESGFYVDFRDKRFRNVKPGDKRLVNELYLLSSIVALGGLAIIGNRTYQERAVNHVLVGISRVPNVEIDVESEKSLRQFISDTVRNQTRK